MGLPFRLVLAILRGSALLIDPYMPLDAPLREDFFLSPFLAAKATPAAICCFFDFAGIHFPPVVFKFSALSPVQSSKRGLLVSSNKTTLWHAFYSQPYSPSHTRRDFKFRDSLVLSEDPPLICQVFVEDVREARPLFPRQMRGRHRSTDRIFVSVYLSLGSNHL